MEFKYTQEDIESLFNYMKTNPSSTLEEWSLFNNSIYTEEEKKDLKYVDVSKILIPFNNKSYIFYLIKWTGVGGGHHSIPFKIFFRKHFNDEYYVLNNMNYGEYSLLTTDADFFEDIETWNNSDIKNIKILKHKIGKVDITITSSLFLDIEDSNTHKLQLWEHDMERNNYSFWDINNIKIYIGDIFKLDYINSLEL